MSHRHSQRWLDHPRSAPAQDPMVVVRFPNRDRWMEAAACDRSVGLPPDEFFSPANDLNTLAALRVCHKCPVRRECLDYALAHPEELDGVWGGTTKPDRARLRRNRRTTA